MGSGTEIARESANVLLLGNDLLKVVELIKIARRCHRIIMTNFAGTLSVDAAGVALAACGYLNPVLAALIHVTSVPGSIACVRRMAWRCTPAGPGSLG
jgi:cation transport ATPase